MFLKPMYTLQHYRCLKGEGGGLSILLQKITDRLFLAGVQTPEKGVIYGTTDFGSYGEFLPGSTPPLPFPKP